MKNFSRSIFLLLIAGLLFLSGCASKETHVPDFAFAQPNQGVTAKHPDVMEKEGGTLTHFSAVMPPQFLVEVEYGVKGVWPLIAGHMSDANAPIADGFCYAIESLAFSNNPWGIVPMQCVILGKMEDFEGYRFALVNKDGGVWISSPAGGTMIDDRSWDVKKFEEDFDHRKEVLGKVGKTLDEIDRFWIDQFSHLGMETEGDVFELVIGSSREWQDFRQSFISEMGYELTMPNGSVVVSSISRDEMVNRLARNPRITRWQKFLSRLSIPVGTPEVIAFGAASSVLNGGIAAMIDSEWKARVARGSGQYRDHASQMVYLMDQFRKSNADNMRYKHFFAQKAQ